MDKNWIVLIVIAILAVAGTVFPVWLFAESKYLLSIGSLFLCWFALIVVQLAYVQYGIAKQKQNS